MQLNGAAPVFVGEMFDLCLCLRLLLADGPRQAAGRRIGNRKTARHRAECAATARANGPIWQT